MARTHLQRPNLGRGPLEREPQSPRFRAELVTDRYRIARNHAIIETELAEGAIPLTCPYTPEQVLDPDYWPESAD